MTTRIEYPRYVFLCDNCKARYNMKEDADNCQKSHDCEHSRVVYEADNYKIEKKCRDCCKTIETLCMTGEELNQEELETIYKILDGTYV
jgi:hypothetical protein